MTKPNRLLSSPVAMFLFLLAVAVLAPAYAAWLAPPPPSAVATVNLERVFNEIKQRADAEIVLERAARQYQEQAEEIRSEAELLKQDLELLVAGTKQYDDAEKKWTQAVLDYSAMIEFSKAKLDAMRAEARKKIYQQILDQTQPFAAHYGIDYIITDDSLIKLEGNTDMQVVQQLALRRLLYANSALDVTEELVAWINR